MEQLKLESQQPEFLAAAEQLAAQHGWELQQLRTAEQPVSAFEHALLEEAIASREGDQPLFSLALMELALAKGYRSPWLQDNRARALVALDRLEEASAIWQQLACCADAALKAAALGMLKQLKLESQQPEFLAAAEQLAAQHGWELQQLRTAEQPVSAFEHALLEEAIASREGDQPLFSLALMELALAKGYRSPWLQDNRARALVALDRLEEASAIWQQLACCADAALKAAALGMLKQLKLESQQPEFLAAAEQLAAQHGWELQQLRTAEQPVSAFEHALLEEAIASREGDQPLFSLALMELALAKGYRSPWLQDNRARALVALDRLEEASAIWQQLACCADAALKAAALGMLKQLKLESQQPEFLAAAEQLAAQHGWELQQLRTAEQPVSAFEHALLEEAIASREGDQPLFSLALMELALAKGYRSPWLQDNRARALVALDRLEEASAIWQQLACCADAALKAAALGMLKQLKLESQQPEFLAAAEQLAAQHGWELQQLRTAEQPVSAFEHALLEEAIASREGDQPLFSLALMELALAKGYRSPWLQDNRARALVALDRLEEASAIWQQLACCADAALKAAALGMLKQLKLESQQPEFLAAAEQLAAQHGWELQQLRTAEQPVSAFEHALLEEAIASREGDQPLFSLALMELALAKGYRSPWLQDNRARALVALDRLEEACMAWRLMASVSGSVEIQTMAVELLAHHELEAEQQRRQRKQQIQIDRALATRSHADLEPAIRDLVDALIVDPDHTLLRQALIKVLEKRRQFEDPCWKNLSSLLQAEELMLEASEVVLSEIMHRFVMTPAGRRSVAQ